MDKHECTWVECPGGICTSDLHSHHCSKCGKNGFITSTCKHEEIVHFESDKVIGNKNGSCKKCGEPVKLKERGTVLD